MPKHARLGAGREKQASDGMVRRVATLSNATRRDGPWEVTFTAEQINGWLAVGMVEDFPNALPLSIKDPRVVISPANWSWAAAIRPGG